MDLDLLFLDLEHGSLSPFIPPHTDPLPLAGVISEVQRIPVALRNHARDRPRESRRFPGIHERTAR